MPYDEKVKIADLADMIVGGYAFSKFEGNLRVVDLNKSEPSVMVFSEDGVILESSMDPIEENIALQKWEENKEFMEAANA